MNAKDENTRTSKYVALVTAAGPAGVDLDETVALLCTTRRCVNQMNARVNKRRLVKIRSVRMGKEKSRLFLAEHAPASKKKQVYGRTKIVEQELAVISERIKAAGEFGITMTNATPGMTKAAADRRFQTLRQLGQAHLYHTTRVALYFAKKEWAENPPPTPIKTPAILAPAKCKALTVKPAKVMPLPFLEAEAIVPDDVKRTTGECGTDYRYTAKPGEVTPYFAAGAVLPVSGWAAAVIEAR